MTRRRPTFVRSSRKQLPDTDQRQGSTANRFEAICEFRHVRSVGCRSVLSPPSIRSSSAFALYMGHRLIFRRRELSPSTPSRQSARQRCIPIVRAANKPNTDRLASRSACGHRCAAAACVLARSWPGHGLSGSVAGGCGSCFVAGGERVQNGVAHRDARCGLGHEEA